MANGSTGAKMAISAKYPRSAEIIRYTIEVDNRLVRTRFGKVITANAICELSRLMRADLQFSPSFSEIIDFTNVEKVEISGDHMMQLSESADPFSPEARRAFVVQTELQTHEARMYGIVRVARDKSRVFRSIGEAERWLSSLEEPKS